MEPSVESSQHHSTEFYQEQINSNLFLVIEHLTETTSDKWQKYSHGALHLLKTKAAQIENQLESERPITSNEVEFLDLKNGSHDAFSQFLDCVKLYIPNVWVAYASNCDPSEFDSDWQSHVEMAVAVLTSHGAPFTKHMGISRNLDYFLRNTIRTKELSQKLHAFAACAMLKWYPSKIYMITYPLNHMRKLLMQCLPSDCYQNGQNQTDSWIQEDSLGFLLKDQGGEIIYTIPRHNRLKYDWFSPNLGCEYFIVTLNALSLSPEHPIVNKTSANTKFTLNDRETRRLRNNSLKGFTSLKKLNLDSNIRITDDGLRVLTNLEALSLRENFMIQGFGLLTMATLTSLNLAHNNAIMNQHLSPLINLTELNLESNTKITDEGFSGLKKLKILNLRNNKAISDGTLLNQTELLNLNLYNNKNITDNALLHLTNMTALNLGCNSKITNKGLLPLTKLCNLSLEKNKAITNEVLSGLVNLTSVDLSDNTIILDHELRGQTQLTTLSLCFNHNISDESITKLTNLTYLDLSCNRHITDQAVKTLTQLTTLNLEHNSLITQNSLNHLTNIKNLKTG